MDPDRCNLYCHLCQKICEKNTEFKFFFRCGGAESEIIELVRGKCFKKYKEVFNKFGFPLYGFRIIYFVRIGLFLCFLFPTNGNYSRSTCHKKLSVRQCVLEKKTFHRQLFSTIHKTCFRSSFHHPTKKLFYPLKFSVLHVFHYLTSETNQPRISNDATQISTFLECINQQASKKNQLHEKPKLKEEGHEHEIVPSQPRKYERSSFRSELRENSQQKKGKEEHEIVSLQSTEREYFLSQGELHENR